MIIVLIINIQDDHAYVSWVIIPIDFLHFGYKFVKHMMYVVKILKYTWFSTSCKYDYDLALLEMAKVLAQKLCKKCHWWGCDISLWALVTYLPMWG